MKYLMVGAIIGDIAGSKYEWHRIKHKPSMLIEKDCEFTDDTIMTCAIAEGLLDLWAKISSSELPPLNEIDNSLKESLASCLKRWGHLYPRSDYGSSFRRWLFSDSLEPYNSFGNGAAMRVSFAGWLARTRQEAGRLGALTSVITHNHPEGLKGASVIAESIFILRQGGDKAAVQQLAQKAGYSMELSIDEIRPGYGFDETCQRTVPEAITAFLEAQDFEDAIKLAISLGGDSDTLAAITASLAEAFYPVPEDLLNRALEKLDSTILAVLERINTFLKNPNPASNAAVLL